MDKTPATPVGPLHADAHAKPNLDPETFRPTPPGIADGPNSGRTMTPTEEAIWRARLRPNHEYRVLQHTTYSVTDSEALIDDAGALVQRKSTVTLASSLTLTQANEIVETCVKAVPDSEGRLLLREDVPVTGAHTISLLGAPREAIRHQLSALGAGASVLFRLEPQGAAGLALRETYHAPIDVDAASHFNWAQAHARMQASAEDLAVEVARTETEQHGGGDETQAGAADWNWKNGAMTAKQRDDWNWKNGAMTVKQRDDYVETLRGLDYDFVAAIRRNARGANDAMMLRLLDEAQVAVDA